MCVFAEQADLAGWAVNKAQEVGGSVRVISRSGGCHVTDTAEVSGILRDMDSNRAATVQDIMESLSGFVQALFALLLFLI